MKEKARWNISKVKQEELITAMTEELPLLRAKVGISQGDLATLVGISRQTYSAIEGHKRRMSWSTYLSLIFFFDYNAATHQTIRSIKTFPKELVSVINNGVDNSDSRVSGIAGIPTSITDRLDAQALHAIRTVVMVEYARCVDMPGEDAVKAFEGITIRPTVTEEDMELQDAIRSLRNRRRK